MFNLCYTTLDIKLFGVKMKNKNLFIENNVKKSTIKYFVISFSVFILLLAGFSVVLFMRSLDYDISNLVENSSTTTTELTQGEETITYSVNNLSGKSNILFIIEEQDGVDFLCVVSTDFDNKLMKVKCIDGGENVLYNGKTLRISSIYSTDYERGIKNFLLDDYGVNIDKYVIFDKKQFKEVLNLFDGFTIDVKNDVDYKSQDFKLSLSSGVQELSPDMTYKYLQISDNNTRESIICNVIRSVLVEIYINDSEDLFTSFVNSCKTDISVIDYSNSVETLKTYCYADDKFYPEIMKKGDN